MLVGREAAREVLEVLGMQRLHDCQPLDVDGFAHFKVVTRKQPDAPARDVIWMEVVLVRRQGGERRLDLVQCVARGLEREDDRLKRCPVLLDRTHEHALDFLSVGFQRASTVPYVDKSCQTSMAWTGSMTTVPVGAGENRDSYLHLRPDEHCILYGCRTLSVKYCREKVCCP